MHPSCTPLVPHGPDEHGESVVAVVGLLRVSGLVCDWCGEPLLHWGPVLAQTIYAPGQDLLDWEARYVDVSDG